MLRNTFDKPTFFPLHVGSTDKYASGKVPGKSISSPLLIVGKKVKSELFDGEVVFDYNIDFDAMLTDSEQRTAKREVEKASRIWK